MVFIETVDDDVEGLIKSMELLSIDKYDQLSQVDTSWNVIKIHYDVNYDADTEEEMDIKGASS